jgi:L-ascorbate metabolism protein UlaG (beta-lactamase superfamily)
MVIQKAGGYGFKISAGPVTVAVNPPSQRSKKHKVSKFGSDVVLISIPDVDWNGADTATHGDKEPFVISGPGAYEVGDVRVTGFQSRSDYGDVLSDVGNTAYIIEMDGIKVLVLGALSSPKLPPELRAEIDDIGIVLVPVGDGTLDPKAAHELVTSIEPKAIIPYAVGSEKDLAAFLKAEGETGVKASDKFTVRKKELDAMDGEVVLLV